MHIVIVDHALRNNRPTVSRTSTTGESDDLDELDLDLDLDTFTESSTPLTKSLQSPNNEESPNTTLQSPNNEESPNTTASNDSKPNPEIQKFERKFKAIRNNKLYVRAVAVKVGMLPSEVTEREL